MLANQRARSARVVEMDVREQQVAQVAQHEAALDQLRLQRLDAGRGPTVLEREPVLGLEQVDADHALGTLVVQVQEDPARPSSRAGS